MTISNIPSSTKTTAPPCASRGRSAAAAHDSESAGDVCGKGYVGAADQPAVHAQAIDGKGIGDRIGSAGFVADKRRYFPFCIVVPLPERWRNCNKAQYEHEQQRQAVSHDSSRDDWPARLANLIPHLIERHLPFPGTKMRE